MEMANQKITEYQPIKNQFSGLCLVDVRKKSFLTNDPSYCDTLTHLLRSLCKCNFLNMQKEEEESDLNGLCLEPVLGHFIIGSGKRLHFTLSRRTQHRAQVKMKGGTPKQHFWGPYT